MDDDWDLIEELKAETERLKGCESAIRSATYTLRSASKVMEGAIVAADQAHKHADAWLSLWAKSRRNQQQNHSGAKQGKERQRPGKENQQEQDGQNEEKQIKKRKVGSAAPINGGARTAKTSTVLLKPKLEKSKQSRGRTVQASAVLSKPRVAKPREEFKSQGRTGQASEVLLRPRAKR